MTKRSILTLRPGSSYNDLERLCKGSWNQHSNTLEWNTGCSAQRVVRSSTRKAMEDEVLRESEAYTFRRTCSIGLHMCYIASPWQESYNTTEAQPIAEKGGILTRKLFFSPTTPAIHFFAIILLLAAYPMQAMQAPASNQADATHRSYDAEMDDHESELNALLTKLRLSFQAVTDGKDGKGHVHNLEVVRQHEKDIVELRGAVRDHHLFAIPTGHQCRADGKEHADAKQHQVRMEAVLSRVVNSFEDYKRANGSPTPGTTQKALDAHRQSLHELAEVIAEHKTVLTALKKCP